MGKIKLRIYSGKATPSPPVGPALGQKGINILEFCKKFNSISSVLNENYLLPTLIYFYSDKSYDFFIKKPTIYFYFKNIHPFPDKFIDFSDILELVKFKIFDFNSYNFYSSIKIVLGVLKSMKISLKS